MSHSAENPKESSMLAKRVVSSKSRGVSSEQIEKKSHSAEKTTVLKIAKFGYSVLVHRENQILKQKIIILKNLTGQKTVNRGTLTVF